MENTWSTVDDYFFKILNKPDSILEDSLKRNAESGLPAYDVSPNQGKLLQIFVRMTKAQSILEIGTLGGYSTIWMARALPDNGHLISLEFDPKHAKVAIENIRQAKQDSKVDVRIGAALETLPKIAAEKHIFDLTFIDADKTNNSKYFEWALKLSHSGSVIIVDNVVRNGNVIDPYSSDPSVVGVRQLNALIQNDPRVDATVVQTVGTKGYDGFIIAHVR
jgi:predicted O-methyltransferase YrrM